MLGGYFGVGIKQVPKSWCAGPGLVKAGWFRAAHVLTWLCHASVPWSLFQLAPGELRGEGSSLWLLFGWHGNAENNNNSSFLAPR